LVDVARAVHFAHQHGILHRDLKPSNVLIDTGGTAYVTDFGLAKRTGVDTSLTETGQPVGTPRYMAPEQAAGRKDVSVAADVYSLGVILYERLTGCTPFVGENVMDLLLQVREAVPPRPSSIRPDLHRDLETICLKCLEKDAGRRYGSAEALAEDLEHWLNGEPIMARPVGRLERGWLWARRNPALATVAGLAVAGLVGVAVMSSIAASQARARARAERERAEVADRAKKDAEIARDKSEGIAARGLIRPLELRDAKQFTEPELESLWELAEKPGERLWLRFLEEATRDPLTTRQLLARAEPSLVAALGLDRAKCDHANRLLERCQREFVNTQEQAANVAIVALQLADPPETAAPHWIEMIVQSVRDHTLNPKSYAVVVDATLRMEPRVAVELLTGALRCDNDARLASGLVAIADKIEAAGAAKILGGAFSLSARAEATEPETSSTSPQVILAKGVAAAASRLGSNEATAVCTPVAQSIASAMENERNLKHTTILSSEAAADALVRLTDRLEPGEGARILAHLLTSADGNQGRLQMLVGQTSICQKLANHAARLAPPDAAGLCGQVLKLVAPIATENPTGSARELYDGLAAVAKFTEVSDAAQAARSLVSKIAIETEPDMRLGLSRALATVASRLPSADAAALSATAGRSLAAALENATDADSRRSLALSLTIVASKMSAAEAAQLCGKATRSLATSLTGTEDRNSKASIVYGLSCLSVRLALADGIKTVRLIAGVMHDSFVFYSRGPAEIYTGIYTLVADDLTATDAVTAARLLVAAIVQETDPKARWWLEAALLVGADKLTPTDGAGICGRVFPELVGAFIRKVESPELWGSYNFYLTDGLKVVLAGLNEPSRAQATQAIADALSRESDTEMRSSLARALASVTERIPPLRAAEIAEILTTAIEREMEWPNHHEPFRALASVTRSMPTAEQSSVLLRAARSHIKRVSRTPFEGDSGESYRSLADLECIARCMEPIAAERLYGELIPLILRRGAAQRIDLLLPHLASSKCKNLAREHTMLICSERVCHADQLESLLSDTDRPKPGIQPDNTENPKTPSVKKPAPKCRLTTQELVELLKMPTLIGKARRVVLDHLGNIHGRRFANHWEFVRFAHEKGLQLDLTTPPRRPNREETVKRMLAILDGKS
jgi:hypothetical protein